MKRIPLDPDSRLQVSGHDYTIIKIVGDGANCIVYDAEYQDSHGIKHMIRVKECYPYHSHIARIGDCLEWEDKTEEDRDKQKFIASYEKLSMWQNNSNTRNSTVVAFEIGEANGTLYIIMNASSGISYDQEFNESIKDNLETVLAISKIVQKYHDQGYLHLDLKPSNVLVVPETRELVILFDFDSITKIEEVQNGNVQVLSYSEGWGAPEQLRCDIKRISPKTDIFSIGAILFYKLMGRQAGYQDMDIFSEWVFPENIFGNKNPKLRRIVRDIYKKTLAVNPERRYQDITGLIIDLEEAISVAREKQPFIISNIPVVPNSFVGRQSELKDIDCLFAEKKRVIFLRGIGGIGKTELARKYGYDNQNRYDLILVLYDVEDLREELQYVEIYNFDGNVRERAKQMKRILTDRTLVIVDNYTGDDVLSVASEYRCRFLVTTRNKYSEYGSDTSSFAEIDIAELSMQNQIQLFENELGRQITEDEKPQLEMLLQRISGYTLLITTVAKQIRNGAMSLKEYLEKIRDADIKDFPQTCVRISKGKELISGDVWTVLLRTFDIAQLTEPERIILDFIRETRKVTFSRKYLLKTLGDEYINPLEELIFNNWVNIYREADGTEYIIIHDIISEILNTEAVNKAWQIVEMIVNRVLDHIFDYLGYNNIEISQWTEICCNPNDAKIMDEYLLAKTLIKSLMESKDNAVYSAEMIIDKLYRIYSCDWEKFKQFPVDVSEYFWGVYYHLKPETKLKFGFIKILELFLRINGRYYDPFEGNLYLDSRDMKELRTYLTLIIASTEGFPEQDRIRMVKKAAGTFFEVVFKDRRRLFPKDEIALDDYYWFREYLFDVGCKYWRKRSVRGIAWCLGLDEYAKEDIYRAENHISEAEFLGRLQERRNREPEDECEKLFLEEEFEEYWDREVENVLDKDFCSSVDEKGRDDAYKEFVDLYDSTFLAEDNLGKAVKSCYEYKYEEAETYFTDWMKQRYSLERDRMGFDLYEEEVFIVLHELGGDSLIGSLASMYQKAISDAKSQEDSDLVLYYLYYDTAELYSFMDNSEMVSELKIVMNRLVNRDFIIKQ